MVDRARLRDWLEGIFIGLLLFLIIQPWAVAIFTQGAYSLHAPGYQRPGLDVSIERTEEPYREGNIVRDFDELVWRNHYRIYRVSVKNLGSDSMFNFRLDVPLPGCSVYTNSEGPTVHGIYTVQNTVQVTTHTMNTSIDLFGCVKTISKQRLLPGESLTVEFVLTRDFDKCDYLVGIDPGNYNYSVQYTWEKRNQLFTENYTASLESPQDIKQHYGGSYGIKSGMIAEDASHSLGQQYGMVLVGVQIVSTQESEDVSEEGNRNQCCGSALAFNPGVGEETLLLPLVVRD